MSYPPKPYVHHFGGLIAKKLRHRATLKIETICSSPPGSLLGQFLFGNPPTLCVEHGQGHVQPDFDCFGSQIAKYCNIGQLKK
jgi:hypothetical protein